MTIEDLPLEWQKHIKELRAENGRLRIRSRDLRARLLELEDDQSVQQ